MRRGGARDGRVGGVGKLARASRPRRIDRVSTFARAAPEHAARGEVVATIRDGVNDAPAPYARRVQCWCSRGDDVSSIVAAVRFGRCIAGDLREGTAYIVTVPAAKLV